MEMPSHVKIDGVKVKIQKKILEDSYGEFSSRKLTIYIDDSYPEEIQKRTLIHEICHTCISFRNQYLVDQIKSVQDKGLLEELICETVMVEFHRVLENNHNLIKYLYGGLK